MSGTVSGSLWGLVLGGVGLGVVSLVNEQPGGSVPPVVPQASEAAAAEATDGEAVAVVATTETDTNVQLVGAGPTIEMDPIMPPQMPDLTAFSKLPETVPDLTKPAVAQDISLQPRFEGVSSAPMFDSDVVITTQPAPPPTAVLVPEEVVPEDVTEQAAVTPDVAEPDAVPAQPEPAALPDVQVQAPAPVLAETAPVVEAPTLPEEAPVADEVVVVPDEAPELPETPTADAPTPFVVGESDPQPSAPVIVSVPEAEPEQETTAGPAVRVNRPGATPAETAGQEAEVVEAEPLPDDAPALERYAMAFEGDTDLPMIAIVMLDAEDMSSAPTDIAALPVPVTVVINALHQDAAARMADYRAAGVEVMLQTALPPGAVPTDVEVAFEAAFDILPETVALFSDASGILQADRSVAVQVIDILGAEGRGLVVVERGLSSSLRIAEQAGLPAAAVLRDLDGDGEDGAAVIRALDQAAFRARQSGNAVLLARVSPETLTALQSWGATNDSDQIALAPVSAVLKTTAGTE